VFARWLFAVIDLHTMEVVARIEPGQNPDGLALGDTPVANRHQPHDRRFFTMRSMHRGRVFCL